MMSGITFWALARNGASEPVSDAVPMTGMALIPAPSRRRRDHEFRVFGDLRSEWLIGSIFGCREPKTIKSGVYRLRQDVHRKSLAHSERPR
jgi:hypothetical protein